MLSSSLRADGAHQTKKVGEPLSWNTNRQRVTNVRAVPQLPIGLPRWERCGVVGQEASREDGWMCWAKSTDGCQNVCSRTQAECWCADAWTANPNCHTPFPAKNSATAQDNRLVSAEVIMVFIHSSQQGLTSKALHPALVFFSKQTSLRNIFHHWKCHLFQSVRESPLH